MSRRVLVTVLAAALTALGFVPAPQATAATPRLRCTASMSNAHPKQYSTVHVRVRTAAAAGITTTAYYKTTRTTHKAKATSKGLGDVPYRISRATKNFKVVVRVTVGKKGYLNDTCSTAFIPR